MAMREEYNYTPKNIGDIVTPIDDGAPWPKCVVLGRTYRVTFIDLDHDASICGIVLDRCDAEPCENDPPCTTLPREVGKWGSRHFRVVQEPVNPVSPEEAAKATPMHAFKIEDAIRFF